jgi:hypothetical protein
MWRQQRIPIQVWSFASNDEGFGQCNIISSCWIHSRFVPHEELAGVPKPLYFGRETCLNFGGHGAVCSPMDSGDSESTNCEIPFPAKKFSFGVFLVGPEFWCGESCHNELFSCSFISSISLCIVSICSLA